MSDTCTDEEGSEFAALREAGRELGASFLPITNDQGVVIRAMLRAAIGSCSEARTAARS